MTVAESKIQNNPLACNKTIIHDFAKPTLTNGSHYLGGTYYCTVGCFTFIFISVAFDSPPNNTILFTLPNGWRPLLYTEITVSGGGSYNAKAQCVIHENGEVNVTSVDKWVRGCGIFMRE